MNQHVLAAAQSRIHHEILADLRPGGDLPRDNLVVRRYHQHELAIFVLLHGLHRHHRLAIRFGRFHLNRCESPRHQKIIRIGIARPHGHGPGCHINLVVQEFDMAHLRIGLAVRQLQVNHHRGLQVGL